MVAAKLNCCTSKGPGKVHSQQRWSQILIWYLDLNEQDAYSSEVQHNTEKSGLQSSHSKAFYLSKKQG